MNAGRYQCDGLVAATAKTAMRHNHWNLPALCMKRGGRLALGYGLAVFAIMSYANLTDAESVKNQAEGSDRDTASARAELAKPGTTQPAAEHRRGFRGRPRLPGPSSGAQPGGPMGKFGRPGHGDVLLTAEEKKELLVFAQKHFPTLYEQLRQESSADIHPYGRMRRLIWPLVKMMRLAKYDPEFAEIVINEHKVEMELAKLRQEYQEFPFASVRERIKDQIRQLLEKRFDLRQRRLEQEIRGLQQRLERAREQLLRQQQDKPQQIDAQMDEFVNNLDHQSPWREDPPPPEGPPPKPN